MTGDPMSLISRYAELCREYDHFMGIAKTAPSQTDRDAAAWSAEDAYKGASEVKMILQGLGIIVRNLH